MDKSPTNLIFISIEKHFQFGRMQFTISSELVNHGVVGPDVAFWSREGDAIAFLLENSDADDDCGAQG
jgi:hypothetical protein